MASEQGCETLTRIPVCQLSLQPQGLNLHQLLTMCSSTSQLIDECIPTNPRAKGRAAYSDQLRNRRAIDT